MANLTGQRFGRLVALRVPYRRDRESYWECRCDCGRSVVVPRGNLKSGNTTSCGCYLREVIRRPHTHGHARKATPTPEYRTWASMVQRCTNPKRRCWKWYGGRGIAICARWLVFENFLADMGPRPPGKTLDRKNNDGNYEPGNCRWATQREQRLNQRAP